MAFILLAFVCLDFLIVNLVDQPAPSVVLTNTGAAALNISPWLALTFLARLAESCVIQMMKCSTMWQ